MFKALVSGIKGIFTKPTKVTAESVSFHREESVKNDDAILMVTIRGGKDVISLLETTLKGQTYQILANEAMKVKVDVTLQDNLYQMPSNMAHTPIKARG
jgi:hypothetical protein